MEDIINLITNAKIVEHLFYNVDVFWCDGSSWSQGPQGKSEKGSEKETRNVSSKIWVLHLT